jgi:osmoprotectant transport system substrate-binding protein
VSSFAFSESVTLAEVYAQALESAGFTVKRVFDLASREIVEPALEQGKVDVVPEYLGTALSFVEPGSNQRGQGQDSLYAQAKAAFQRRGVTLLNPAAAQDQNGIVVTRETSQRYHLDKISDLAPVAHQLDFGGPPECPERPFCLLGLESRYGLRFRSFRTLDAGGAITVGALQTSTVAVALMFTSDAHLAEDQFRLLHDDLSLQPAENVVPMVRSDVIQRFGPKLADQLNKVSAHLTNDDLVGLNHRVDIDGETPAHAASVWLRLRGISQETSLS